MKKVLVFLMLIAVCISTYGQNMETERQSLATEAGEIVAEVDLILLSEVFFPIEQVEKLCAKIDSFGRRYHLWVAVYNPSRLQDIIQQLHFSILQGRAELRRKYKLGLWS